MTSAKIQMYRLNELGDCFLLTFDTGGQTSRMLIDCGSFRNGGPSITRIREIIRAIGKEVDGNGLDVVVGTHQHNDHLSGFVHGEDDFKAIGVKQVWLSWLDDPDSDVAVAIGKDVQKLALKLTAARNALRRQSNGARALGLAGQRTLDVIEDVLGFRGAPENGAALKGAAPELPERGARILKEISGKKPKYLVPGRTLDMPGLPPDSVKIHVLGPPAEEKYLYDDDPKKGESYDHSLAAANLSAAKLLSALTADGDDEDRHYPFAERYKRRGREGSKELKGLRRDYDHTRDAWRAIDDDWLMQAEALALYLDTYTNNSSLALAIELVESGKVLLFAADAQTGNWLSWKDVKWKNSSVKTADLLARSVFYKVGHHGSHNSTLVEAFEKMNHPDLVAFIPVHKQDSNIKKKKHPWRMPAAKLFERIKEKTRNRVLQMDGDNPPECDPAKGAKAAWKEIGIKPKITADFVEITIA